MAADTSYIVVVCGYEGFESIFAPLSYQEALELHNQLKQVASKEWDEAKNSLAEERWGLLRPPGDPDQVCIMSGEPGSVAECACEQFPDRIPNQGTWLH